MRVVGAGRQGREHREPLGRQHGVLRGPVGLFGVDVGHVLAGVDRVHVPGLRRRLTPALRQLGAHRREELARQRAYESRPGVAGGPVAMDRGDPCVGRRVVGADGQQHVAGQRHRFELIEQLVRGVGGLAQRGRGVHPPPRRVMRGHVVGEQAAARRRDPLELAAELHAAQSAVAVHRAPLVVRSPGPRTRRQAGVGGQARELRVVAEHVQLPRGRRVGTQDVALKTHAVHQVSDGRFRAGEIGVRFVVGAAQHLDAALRDEPAQVGAVLGAGVPVRLEVVHLGEHELVLGLAAGHLQVGVHELEAVGLPGPPRRILGPFAGVGALGVPPHRVVVEVTDHEHGPAGLGDRELERQVRAPGAHPRGPSLADHRTVHGDGDLDELVADIGDRLPGQAVPVDADPPRLAHPGDGDARQLQRGFRRPDEKLRRLRRNQLHPRTLRRRGQPRNPSPDREPVPLVESSVPWQI